MFQVTSIDVYVCGTATPLYDLCLVEGVLETGFILSRQSTDNVHRSSFYVFLNQILSFGLQKFYINKTNFILQQLTICVHNTEDILCLFLLSNPHTELCFAQYTVVQ